jgi:hypothetical protein
MTVALQPFDGSEPGNLLRDSEPLFGLVELLLPRLDLLIEGALAFQ